LSNKDIEVKIDITDINDTIVDVPSDFENTDDTAENKETLGQYAYGEEKVTKNFISEYIKNYNIKEPSSKCYKYILSFLNDCSSTDFLDSISSYSKWKKTKRLALAYLVKFEVLDINTLIDYGVDDSDLVTLVNDL
jgi:hypothetical protein